MNTQSQKIVSKKSVPCTESEMQINVPASTHDSFGGVLGKVSAVQSQIQNGGKNTRARLKSAMMDQNALIPSNH